MSDETKLLDHGYARVIEHWGSDERIIEAARMSTAKGFLGWGPKCARCGDAFDAPERDCPSPGGATPYVDCGRGGHVFTEPGDEKLLKYLWDHDHQTPFEMVGMTIEVKAPILVFREWQRHRVPFGYNEMSARYTALPNENYVPDAALVLERANAKTSNRQAQGMGAPADRAAVHAWLKDLDDVYEQIEAVYQNALAQGIPKELARIVLPVGRYSVMRVTANLRGWLAFMKLRCAPNAQHEIRVYADAVATFVRDRYPRTYEVARASCGLP